MNPLENLGLPLSAEEEAIVEAANWSTAAATADRMPSPPPIAPQRATASSHPSSSPPFPIRARYIGSSGEGLRHACTSATFGSRTSCIGCVVWGDGAVSRAFSPRPLQEESHGRERVSGHRYA